MKRKISVRLSEQVVERLEAAAQRPGASKTTIVEAALDGFLDPGTETIDDATLLRRLDCMSRQIEQLERDLRIVNETVALHARYHLAITPPLPQSQQRAACALGHVHCIVPGGGLAPDGRWVACRPGFFLPVHVLSRLYRRLFLERLLDAFDAGQLNFFGDLAALAEPAAFARRLAPLRQIAWVIYAKRPFGGAEQVLDYLSRYTHRVAIANSRLLACEDGRVCFRWKDYRVRDKTKTMSLDVDEFIRRFLLHVLPDQFRRIRHFGFLANACRTAKLARIRAALALPEPTPVAEPTDYRERYALLIGQRIDLCPCCGGRMVEVGFTARMPRNSSPYRHPRCDTS